MMEMATQIPSTIKVGTNVLSSSRRPVGSARKRQRARELASGQLSLSFDFDALESMTTLKPAVDKLDPERVYSTPRLRVIPVYNDSVAPSDDGRVHCLARTDFQCSYPTWSDDGMSLVSWTPERGQTVRTIADASSSPAEIAEVLDDSGKACCEVSLVSSNGFRPTRRAGLRKQIFIQMQMLADVRFSGLLP